MNSQIWSLQIMRINYIQKESVCNNRTETGREKWKNAVVWISHNKQSSYTICSIILLGNYDSKAAYYTYQNNNKTKTNKKDIINKLLKTIK